MSVVPKVHPENCRIVRSGTSFPRMLNFIIIFYVTVGRTKGPHTRKKVGVKSGAFEEHIFLNKSH